MSRQTLYVQIIGSSYVKMMKLARVKISKRITSKSYLHDNFIHKPLFNMILFDHNSFDYTSLHKNYKILYIRIQISFLLIYYVTK